jgi:hypothetical protein
LKTKYDNARTYKEAAQALQQQEIQLIMVLLMLTILNRCAISEYLAEI